MFLNLLGANRFHPALLERVEAYPILIDPMSALQIPTALSFLNSNRLLRGERRVKRRFFTHLQTLEHQKVLTKKHLEESLRELGLWACRAPYTNQSSDFDKALNGKFVAVSELYSNMFTQSLGGCRTFLLPFYNFKGTGNHLPPWSFDHFDSSGITENVCAIYSFFISKIMNNVLPLGVQPVTAVLYRPDLDVSIVVRRHDVPRFSQVFIDISEKEREKIKNHIFNFHQTRNLNFIVDNILQQVACGICLSSSGIGSLDNMLVDGRLLDEEDWVLNEDPELVSWHYQFKEPISSGFENLTKEFFDKSLLSSSFQYFPDFFYKFNRALKLIFQEYEVLSAQEMEKNFLKMLRNYGVNLDEKWKTLKYLKSSEQPREALALIKSKGVDVSLEDDGRILKFIMTRSGKKVKDGVSSKRLLTGLCARANLLLVKNFQIRDFDFVLNSTFALENARVAKNLVESLKIYLPEINTYSSSFEEQMLSKLPELQWYESGFERNSDNIIRSYVNLENGEYLEYFY